MASTINPPGNLQKFITIKDVRNKYVCFNCKHIWKSSVSKYMKYCETNEKQIPNYDNTNKKNKIDLIYAYDDVYTHKTSKCAKCSQFGILVGRNFRHCKNKKEWNVLKQKVDKGEIDLYKDFYDYPRELYL
jgi:hypothetical protein